jgi:hypothetical protein
VSSSVPLLVVCIIELSQKIMEHHSLLVHASSCMIKKCIHNMVVYIYFLYKQAGPCFCCSTSYLTQPHACWFLQSLNSVAFTSHIIILAVSSTERAQCWLVRNQVQFQQNFVKLSYHTLLFS